MKCLEEAVSEIDSDSLSDFVLCDNCLGRLFAKVGTGRSNESRGIMVRQIMEMQPCREPSECHVCRGIAGSYDRLADMALEALEPWEFSNFLVGTRFEPEVEAAEEQIWSQSQTPYSEPIKAEFNREIGKRLERMTGKEVEFGRPEVVVVIDTLYEMVDVQVSPIHIYGRYRKLERGIPQTRWPCRKCRGKGCERCNETGMMYPDSVEELAGKVAMDITGGSDHRFHGMGREDIDALMLGNGRPFVLEIKEPRKRSIDFPALEERINGSTDKIAVSQLRASDPQEVVRIKQARPRKSYRVLVGFSAPVEEENLKEVVLSLGGISIFQRTPMRVSHRRADKERERRVEALDVEMLGPREARFSITAEAGTYIKEFVHGDGGRTVPSIAGKLDMDCEVKTLDVLEILDQ